MIAALIDRADRYAKPSAALQLVHATLWTALPTALYPNLPLDLIEALTYGREWQLGTDKLPPCLVDHRLAYQAFGSMGLLPDRCRSPCSPPSRWSGRWGGAWSARPARSSRC